LRAPTVRLLALILLTLSLFGCDYASKFAAKATLEGAEAIAVAPAVLRGAVELRYVENDDVAFNALRVFGVPRSPELLVGLASLAVAGLVVLAVMAWRRLRVSADGGATPPVALGDRIAGGGSVESVGAVGAGLVGGGADGRQRVVRAARMTQVGFALVFSGALGNIVDRIARGYVVDFIHVRGWPVFNVADIAVVVGMGLIALAALVGPPSAATANR